MLISDLNFLAFVPYVYISYVSCLLSFNIYVCMMFRFCNLPSACWLGALINMNWIGLNYYYYFVNHIFQVLM